MNKDFQWKDGPWQYTGSFEELLQHYNPEHPDAMRAEFCYLVDSITDHQSSFPRQALDLFLYSGAQCINGEWRDKGGLLLPESGRDHDRLIAFHTTRLELSYLTGECWDFRHWQRYLNFPYMRQAFREGLVWRGQPGYYFSSLYHGDVRTWGQNPIFFHWRQDEPQPTGADGAAFDPSLLETCKIDLAHPAMMSKQGVQRWKDLFDEFEIIQPFPQLDRPIEFESWRKEPHAWRLTDRDIRSFDRLGFHVKGIGKNEDHFRTAVSDYYRPQAVMPGLWYYPERDVFMRSSLTGPHRWADLYTQYAITQYRMPGPVGELIAQWHPGSWQYCEFTYLIDRITERAAQR